MNDRNISSSSKRESDQYDSSEESTEENNFKPVFKKFKKRSPPPDFSNVIDVKKHHVVKSQSVFGEGEVDVSVTAAAESLGLIDPSMWRVYTFPDRQGLYILPGLLRKSLSVEWLRRTFEYAKPPAITNLSLHGTDIERMPNLRSSSLRWTTLGISYDWNSKEYPTEGDALPQELFQLGELICQSLKLGPMLPDAAIVNYYPPKATLSPHVDRSERSNAPLVSMSLGQSAVYLSGGITLSETPIPIWLRNGDVLVMHGDQRLVYHAIPCIGVDSMRETFNSPDCFLEEYLNTSRVNITLRQVNKTY